MHLGKIQKILITMEEETNFHQTGEGLGLSSCSESDRVWVSFPGPGLVRGSHGAEVPSQQAPGPCTGEL